MASILMAAGSASVALNSDEAVVGCVEPVKSLKLRSGAMETISGMAERRRIRVEEAFRKSWYRNPLKSGVNRLGNAALKAASCSGSLIVRNTLME
jgi:hypothetical protein